MALKTIVFGNHGLLISKGSHKILELTRSHQRLFFDATSKVNNRKTFTEKKLIGFSMEQMYSVVSDVENYNKFVPFCKKSHVYNRRKGFLKGDLIIGFPPLNERYTSNVTMEQPTLVKAECFDGVLFNYLLTIWKFSPGLKGKPRSCVVDFDVAFEFRSALTSQLANVFFNEVVIVMVKAFYNEAKRRYGPESVPSRKINIVSSGGSDEKF